MKFMALLLASLLMAGCSASAGVPSHDELKATTLRLVSKTAEGWSVCGGTAVSASSYRTAKHCVEGKTLESVNDKPAKVASIKYDEQDAATVTLTEPVFKAWAIPGALPKQGDRVRFWGNPKGVPDVFRVGVVVNTAGGVVAVDVMACFGDSGSGLFNDAGELVAVVSRLAPEVGPCQFMVAQP